MYIKRSLEDEVEPFLRRKEVIAILGPRQAGKTTFLQHLAQKMEKAGKKVKFLTFESHQDLEGFQEDIEYFKQSIQGFDAVFIDEFQYARDGGQKLKYLFDTTQTKYVISGSSSLELTFQTGRYMVGRMITFTLQPLSFKEYLSFKDKALATILQRKTSSDWQTSTPDSSLSKVVSEKLERYFEEYILEGGYPAVVTAQPEEKQKILAAIVDNYLLKDIKNLLQLSTDEALWRLVKLLATQIGNLIEYNELGTSSGLSYQKLREHLRILEQTYIIHIFRPFFQNKRTEIVKNPKVYFVDNGLRNFALKDFRPLKLRNDAGSLVENYVHNRLSSERLQYLYFWRTKNKAEVDFIIEKEGTLVPVEVKYTNKPIIGKSLYSFIEKFKPTRAFVLTKGFIGEKKIADCTVIFRPVYSI